MTGLLPREPLPAERWCPLPARPPGRGISDAGQSSSGPSAGDGLSANLSDHLRLHLQGQAPPTCSSSGRNLEATHSLCDTCPAAQAPLPTPACPVSRDDPMRGHRAPRVGESRLAPTPTQPSFPSQPLRAALSGTVAQDWSGAPATARRVPRTVPLCPPNPAARVGADPFCPPGFR